jgi:hypothetical protein
MSAEDLMTAETAMRRGQANDRSVLGDLHARFTELMEEHRSSICTDCTERQCQEIMGYCCAGTATRSMLESRPATPTSTRLI